MYEVYREVHVVTERREGAVFKTAFLEHRWVPLGEHGDGKDLVYVTPVPALCKNPRVAQ